MHLQKPTSISPETSIHSSVIFSPKWSKYYYFLGFKRVTYFAWIVYSYFDLSFKISVHY